MMNRNLIVSKISELVLDDPEVQSYLDDMVAKHRPHLAEFVKNNPESDDSPEFEQYYGFRTEVMMGLYGEVIAAQFPIQ